MSTDKLKDYTADLLTLETHLFNAVKKQRTSERVSDNDAMELMNELDQILRNQIDALESHLDK